MKKTILFGAILALAFGAGQAVRGASGQHGEPSVVVASGYESDNQEAAFRTGIQVADSTTIATLTSTTTGEIGVFGKPNLRLDAVFTTSTQTIVVGLLLERKDGSGNITNTWWSNFVTLSATTKPGPGDSGFATSPGFTFDTGGATHARAVVTTGPVGGPVKLYVGTF